MTKIIFFGRKATSYWRLYLTQSLTSYHNFTYSAEEAMNRLVKSKGLTGIALKVQVTTYKPHRYDAVLKFSRIREGHYLYKSNKISRPIGFCKDGIDKTFMNKAPKTLYITLTE